MRQKLFAGPAFTLPCRISSKGLALKLKGLIDTGAGSYVLVHPKFARTIERSLHIPIFQMQAVKIAGYDSVPNAQVDKHFKADLVLDNHRIRTFYVLCNTGRHDIIVGRKFLEQVDVWVNCKRRLLQ